ncbi:unnamed protein product [Urochloa humidicola]
MAELLGPSSSKKWRAGEEREGFEAAAAAEEEDRISGLLEDLRLRILSLLPLNSAIRTGALSTRWRALWARRWPAPSSLDGSTSTSAPATTRRRCSGRSSAAGGAASIASPSPSTRS